MARRFKTTRTKPSLCPACGYAVDAASPTLDPRAVPKPGDISLCLRCAAVNRFGADLSIEAAPGFMAEIAQEDPKLAQEIERQRALILLQRATDPIPERGGRA